MQSVFTGLKISYHNRRYGVRLYWRKGQECTPDPSEADVFALSDPEVKRLSRYMQQQPGVYRVDCVMA